MLDLQPGVSSLTRASYDLELHGRVADTDGDGLISTAERSAFAARECGDVVGGLSAAVGGSPLRWAVRSATVAYSPGQAGLATTRLTCELSAAARLDRAATLSVSDSYRADRVGWHEITAVGNEVRLLDPQVPATSVSDELRRYPNDLLSSPLGVRAATLRTQPGSGVAGGALGIALPTAGVLERWSGGVTSLFTDLAGGSLTPLFGCLAVLLALVVGAAHAALPGHGKTVMAAYLAGRHGTRRDAVVVGATVTLTHTAGVLVLVICYGAGMAATLTAAGLILVRVRDHLHASHSGARLRQRAAALVTVLPVLTALLVLVVGLGLAASSIGAAG